MKPRLEWVAPVMVAWLSTAVSAQESLHDPQPDLRGLQTLTRIGQRLKQLGDWGQQHDLIDRAVNNVWEQHQWQSEADLFARDTVLEVAKIPPWEIDARLETLVGRYADRYAIGPGPREQLKQRMYGHALGLMWKHAGVMMEQTDAMVELRVQGKPFTPELVAQWIRDSEPMFEDATARLDSMAEEFSKHVDAQHQELWARDLEGFQRRMTQVRQDRQGWARGEWSPKSWGLQDDPIHQGSVLPAAQPGVPGSPTSQPVSWGRALAYDPATWKWYLHAFTPQYALDPGQRAAAESILVELVERANFHLRTHRAQLEPIPPQQRLTDPAFAPVRAIFHELEARLERILTGGQRRQAVAQPTAE